MEFSHGSADFTLRLRDERQFERDALSQKKIFFIYDATNSHSKFDNTIFVRGQEQGEPADHMDFSSRPVALHLGQYHTVEVQVSRFEETERYSKLANSQKECLSKNGLGAKRFEISISYL